MSSSEEKIVIRERSGEEVTETTAAASAAPRRRRSRLINEEVEGKKPWVSHADPYIWGIYWCLMVVSVIELFSASSTEISGTNVYAPLIRHGIFLVLGTALVFWLQKIHYAHFRRWAAPLAILSLGLLVLTYFFGVEINGAQRALRVAGFTIQPPEIAKLTVILWLATILGRNQQPGGVSNSGVVGAAIVVVIFGAALWRNGLTNTILLMGVSISMLMIGGVQWKKLGIVLLVYGVCAGCLGMVKYVNNDDGEFERVEQTAGSSVSVSASGDEGINRTGTQKERIRRFIRGVHPEDPLDDMNRQVMMSKFAQANGGLTGCGPGNSRESARLPLAFSDYIYSIIIEDTGFIGGVMLMVLYLFLLARAGRIAYRCSRAFPAFLILGCAVLIVFQALVHMAIVVGVFPVSGQPLPFISKGGTSVLVMSAAIGIMLSVSRYAVTGKDDSKRKQLDEVKGLGADMQAANISGDNHN